MSCCGASPDYEEINEVSRLVSAKLAAFLKTLRDNAFIVGLHEGRDAAALMAAGYAEKPGLLRVAFKHLFSARKSDWDRFDGLFDAFWLGRRVKSRSITTGSAKPANNPSLKSLQDSPSERAGSEAATDQVPSADDTPGNRAGEGRMEGASRADNLAEVDFRKLADPDQIEQAHAAAARLARIMRTRLTRGDLAARLPARFAKNHPQQYQPWRRSDQPRQAPAQGETAAADRAARRFRLDEHVHRRVPALHPRRARRIPAGRGIPVSHEARLCVRCDEGKGCRPRAGSAVDHGTGCRRRHPDRRKPADLQPLARRAGDPFAQLRDDRVRRL